jgi:hypothetical protein
MTVLMRGDPDLRAAFLFKLCDTQCNGSVERRELLYVLNSSDYDGQPFKLRSRALVGTGRWCSRRCVLTVSAQAGGGRDP